MSKSPAGNLRITNVRIAASENPLELWEVECREGKVANLWPLSTTVPTHQANMGLVDGLGGIIVPSLCHSHIHLDKCFILGRGGDIVRGDFPEAMTVTANAKAEFSSDTEDLLRRGRKLICDSVECGVTSMRAHVEVDTVMGLNGIDVALKLKKEFKSICDIQIAAFAQERLFDSIDDKEPGPNYRLLLEAIDRRGVDVIGSAPYVEPSIEQAKKNIELILEAAGTRALHLDFHLDYSLDPASEPLIYEVVAQVKKRKFVYRRITIGHATRLQLFTPQQWRDLVQEIGELPITFVALPSTDMYMQGKGDTETPLGAPRSTLRVPYLAKQYGLEVAMSVNNIENAFTPQGPLDPLSLCTFGVTIFQAATIKDLESLLRSVTITSKLAIGHGENHRDVSPSVGDPADFVILHGTTTLAQAVLNPSYGRTTIKAGEVIARRQTERFVYGLPS
ncbi:Metallo-dependent hydrolase [Marasmius fiardii PR-910]|nr:Metallo-dependent hydrolase [Marasmius fiardii PR-910]